MRAVLGLVACVLLAGCDASTSLYLSSPWPADQLALILILDPDGAPLVEKPEIMAPGRPVRVGVPGDAPVEVLAWTYPADIRAPNGEPLAQCGVRFGGPGRAVSGRISTWSSGQVSPGTAPSFSPDPTPPSFDLRFERCNEDDDPCAGISYAYLDLPETLQLWDVVFVSDDLAFFSGAPQSGVLGPMTLGRIDLGQASIFQADPQLTGHGIHLAWDRASSIYGVTLETTLFRFDFQGSPLPVTADLDRRAQELSIGEDGTILVAATDGLYELARDSTVARARSELRGPPQLIHVVARDRIVATDDRPAIIVFDGSGWHPEHALQPFDVIDTVNGDRTTLLAAGALEKVLRRNESTMLWEPLPAPAPFSAGEQFLCVAPAGRDRFLATTLEGGIAVYDHGRWCPLLVSSTRKLHGCAVSPSGALGYTVGEARADESHPVPPIVRIALPPPRDD